MSEKRVQDILKEAVEIEIAFVRAGLPNNLVGLSVDDMCEYVQFCGDRLMSMLVHPYKPIWKAKQPLVFMEMISIDAKTNFFERRVSEYTMAGVGQSQEDTGFSLDATFWDYLNYFKTN